MLFMFVTAVAVLMASSGHRGNEWTLAPLCLSNAVGLVFASANLPCRQYVCEEIQATRQCKGPASGTNNYRMEM
jgi:hypothetical protein